MGRQLGRVLFHRRANCLPQCNDRRVNALKQVTVRLGAATDRLFQRLATGYVQGA
jgi:hypothetical protein